MEKKKLIPAYNNLEQATKNYIVSTTKESNPIKIKYVLSKYKNQIATEQVVCDIIDKILFNEKVLNKIVVVNDLKYRNCTMIITNNKVTVTNTGGYSNINPKYTYSELLKYFAEKSEKIFIYLENYSDKTIFEMPILINNIPSSGVMGIIKNIFDDDNLLNGIHIREQELEKRELQITMLKGELSAINDKINECLDATLNNNCNEKKYFYNTMFTQLCKEKENIQNELNKIKNT